MVDNAILTDTRCTTCTHSNGVHDKWGICLVATCEPCHLDMECPRCGHVFGTHNNTPNMVYCNKPKKDCKYAVCYSNDAPNGRLWDVTVMPLSTEYVYKPPKVVVEKGWAA